MNCPYCKDGRVKKYAGGNPYDERCAVCDGSGQLSESPIPYLASIAASLALIAKNIDAVTDDSGKYIWIREAWKR